MLEVLEDDDEEVMALRFLDVLLVEEVVGGGRDSEESESESLIVGVVDRVNRGRI